MKIIKLRANLTLGLIVLLGGILRFYNLNWSDGYPFNPDEINNIIVPVTQLEYPFHPQSFTYGSLTIYLYHFLARGISIITNTPLWQDAQQIALIGRFVSALLSTLTILAVYKLALKLAKSKRVALFSAAFTSLSVGAVQASHFATTETILTLAGVLLAQCVLIIASNKNYSKGYFWSGILIGVATSAKLSALIFLPPVLLAHVSKLNRNNLRKRNLASIASLILAILVFITISPYSILDHDGFISSFNFERQIATGGFRVFFTSQFENTLAYYFQIKHVFPWIIGWPATILGFLGLLQLMTRGIKEKMVSHILFAFLPLFYFAYTASLYVKWARYMVPLLPFIAIGTGLVLTKLSKKSVQLVVVVAIFVLYQLLHTLSFLPIYASTDTRIQASEWIYKNIPEESKLLLEPMDVVSLPLNMESANSNIYKQSWFDFYALDNGGPTEKQIKIDELAKALSENNYLIIGSRRIYGNRMNKRYPLTKHYYSLLFAESLGYKPVYEMSSYPRLVGIEFKDDMAEETFQVFDHPKILIYKNVGNLDQETLKALLATYEH